jgi:hypothetical protein
MFIFLQLIGNMYSIKYACLYYTVYKVTAGNVMMNQPERDEAVAFVLRAIMDDSSILPTKLNI